MKQNIISGILLIVALTACSPIYPIVNREVPEVHGLGKLAIYFGFPSSVNGAADLDEAAAVFADYDVVVFADKLQLPQYDPTDPNSNPVLDHGCTQNAHPDHDNAVAIVNKLRKLPYNTRVYGYVSIGGENTARICPSESCEPAPLTDLEIREAIVKWQALGVTGLYFDEAGYEFGTSRQRQNAAVDYAHSLGLPVFINAYEPDEIFSSEEVGFVTYSVGTNLGGQQSSIEMNPRGEPTHLGSSDIALLESFQINLGNYQDPGEWQERSEKALHYKQQFGTKIATVTTSQEGYPDCGFTQAKFDYAWWSTLLYGFNYMGWGEGTHYSASGECNSSLPLRNRPDPGGGSVFGTSVVTHDGPLHTRLMESVAGVVGVIEVNTDTHTGRFIRCESATQIAMDQIAMDDRICPE